MKRFESLFTRLRTGRSGLRSRLLVRPPIDPADSWQWCSVPGNQSGDWPPPANLMPDTIVLIIPAALCSHFQVAAPPGLKRHEWPLLLEDVLQQPADQVQVSQLSRIEGYVELLVVERARINGWLADCEALGIAPSCLWAEPQLLPPQPPGQQLHWHRAGDRCIIRGAENGAQHWLVWPPVLGDLPEQWRQPNEEMTGAWPAQWAVLERLPNLLESPVVRLVKAPRGHGLFTRTQRRLAGACTTLALFWVGVLGVQFWQQIPAWKAQVEAVTGPVNNAQQAARSLARLQALQTDWRSRQQQVTELETAVSHWLASQKGWGVSGNYFDGRSWRLVLNGNAAPPPVSHWQAMGKAVGATASVEPNDKASLLTVHFDLGVQP